MSTYEIIKFVVTGKGCKIETAVLELKLNLNNYATSNLLTRQKVLQEHLAKLN